MMDLSNKRCGECGHKSYKLTKLSGKWNKHWKQYSEVYLKEELELWVCNSCGSHAVTPGDEERIDKAISVDQE
jgi:hypothetical protein